MSACIQDVSARLHGFIVGFQNSVLICRHHSCVIFAVWTPPSRPCASRPEWRLFCEYLPCLKRPASRGSSCHRSALPGFISIESNHTSSISFGDSTRASFSTHEALTPAAGNHARCMLLPDVPCALPHLPAHSRYGSPAL